MTPALPSTVKDFRKREKNFNAWLVNRGSAILEPTNPFEVSRFLTGQGVGIIHRNRTDRITSWLNGADAAFHAFLQNQDWRAVERGTRHTAKRRNQFATLVARDGCSCMFCAEPLTIETATIEHVVAITHGGTDHPSNLALACRGCNVEADHLSAREKFELAMAKRLARMREVA